MSIVYISVACEQGGLDADVIAAVKRANALEEQLFAAPDKYSSWDDVYRHYRQGYGEEIARRLADYWWWPEGNGVRPGDRTMAVPDTVIVLQLTDTYAVVAYPHPDWLQEAWGLEKYTVDRLDREGDHWVIVDAKSTDEIPVRTQ
ncbi:MAG: hypothetical protein ACYSVY_01090 [Planctomycetota bacterium]|jgi:hypothetical protein